MVCPLSENQDSIRKPVLLATCTLYTVSQTLVARFVGVFTRMPFISSMGLAANLTYTQVLYVVRNLIDWRPMQVRIVRVRVK